MSARPILFPLLAVWSTFLIACAGGGPAPPKSEGTNRVFTPVPTPAPAEREVAEKLPPKPGTPAPPAKRDEPAQVAEAPALSAVQRKWLQDRTASRIETFLDPSQMRRGESGRSKFEFKLIQTVDFESALVECGRDTFLVLGVNLSRFNFGDYLSLSDFLLERVEDHSYRTLIGSLRTVTTLQAHPVPPLPVKPRTVSVTPKVNPAPEPDVPPTPKPPHPLAAPPPGEPSPWQKLGQVSVRVVGAARRRVPLLNADNKPSTSDDAKLVVWVEVLNAGPAPRSYRRWETPREHSVVAGGEAAAAPAFPPNRRLDRPNPNPAPLPPDGPGLVEPLAWEVPVGGRLTLTLDAGRVGEKGEYRFDLPAPPPAPKE